MSTFLAFNIDLRYNFVCKNLIKFRKEKDYVKGS